MIETTNLKLLKPELTDPADITATNVNWDTIDTKIKALEDFSKGNYAKASTVVHTILSANNWLHSTYTWSNSNITSSDQIIELLPQPSISSDQLIALQSANIIGTQQSVGSIRLVAYGDVPTIDVPVTFIIRGDV